MIAEIKLAGKAYTIDLNKPLDISMELRDGPSNVNVWYVDPPSISPHVAEGMAINVSEGASVNFNDIAFNPHAHGTHTECVGHITKAFHSVNQSLQQYFFLAKLVTIAPERKGQDFVISQKQLEYALSGGVPEAVVIRTLPNTRDKCSRQYSNTNPPYVAKEAMEWLVAQKVEHLLLDLPSVDKEKDNGELASHHAFWNTSGAIRHRATITELIYVDNSIADGSYFLELQLAPFQNDASPSRPILYAIMNEK